MGVSMSRTDEIADLTRKLQKSEMVGYGYTARKRAIQARIDDIRAKEADAEMKEAR